ncbi:MAG: hypothetical protein AAF264_00010 [Pseudomonadota bacterium]
MQDPFDDHMTGLESPPTRAAAVAPNDAADLAMAGRAINVAGSGTVQVTTTTGSTVVIYVAAGVLFPIRVRRIWASNTTATDIVVLT